MDVPSLDWYRYRSQTLSSFIQLSQSTIYNINSNLQSCAQWGSIYDTAVRRRGTILFPQLISLNQSQVIWIDDAPTYPHNFGMDYLRSNLPNQCWLANEIDSPTISDDLTYYTLAQQSYDHGASVISVANWDINTLQQRITLFQNISKDFLNDPVSNKTIINTMNISALKVFNLGSAMSYVDMYNQLSNQGKDWVKVVLQDDLS